LSIKVIHLVGHYVVFRACEMGRKEMVKTLLEYNADGRIHPVTKYSPLYIACYNGRKDIVELLLKVRHSVSDIYVCHFPGPLWCLS
jgi:ankyrin repeat protein